MSLDASPPSPPSHPETNESVSLDLPSISLETEVVAEEETQIIEQPAPAQEIEKPTQAQEIEEQEQELDKFEQAIEEKAPATVETAQAIEKAIDQTGTIVEEVVPSPPSPPPSPPLVDEPEEIPIIKAVAPPPPPPPPSQESEILLETPAKQETTDLPEPESPSASKSVAFDPSVQDPKGGRLGKRDKKSEKVKVARAQAIKDEKKAKEDVLKEKERAKRKAAGEKTKVIKNAKGQIVVITEKKATPALEKKEASTKDIKSSPSKSSKRPDKKGKGKDKEGKKGAIEDQEDKKDGKPLKGVLKDPTPSFDDKPRDSTSGEPIATMAETISEDALATSDENIAPEQASQGDPVTPGPVNDTEAISNGTSNPFLCAAREWAAELKSRARSWRMATQKSGCKVEKWRQSIPMYAAVENLSRNSLVLSIKSLPGD